MKILKRALAVSLISYAQFAFTQAPTADELMQRNFMTSKFADATNDVTMKLINKDGQERIRETKSVAKLLPGTTDNQRLITFLSPSDVKGTKNLLIEHSESDDDIWIYLPALKKVRRLVASNKKDAFAGTDFSYADIIGYKVGDWNHKLIKEDKVDGRECYQIESTPKSEPVSSMYGISKRINCIDKESAIALSGETYDRGGKLFKKYSAQNPQKLDVKNNKWTAMKLEAINVDTGHKTVLEFKNFKVNGGVSDAIFTARSLEKR